MAVDPALVAMTYASNRGSLGGLPLLLDMMEIERLSGRCACGQTTFQVEARTTGALCHCDICRQVSGGLGMVWIDGLRASLVMQGPVSRWRSSTHAYRHFCSVCGTQLLRVEDGGGDVVGIAVGALQAQERISIDHGNYVDSLPDWAATLWPGQRDSS